MVAQGKAKKVKTSWMTVTQEAPSLPIRSSAPLTMTTSVGS
jgi:hypothetical protein